MDSVVHFEMPCEDRDRVARFYKQVFGWQMTMFGEEMGNYVLANTAPTGENGRPTEPGTINGGFYPRDTGASPYPSVVIAVADLEASMAAVKKAGGTLHGEPVAIPGIGRFISFTDTEGNRISILQGDAG